VRVPGKLPALRPAAPTDFPTVLALLRRADLPVDGISTGLADFIVAEMGGGLVGVIGLEVYGEAALLRSAAVQEGRRGSGIGRALVRGILELARRRGVRDVYLLTTTAEHYFPKFGFTQVDRASAAESIQASAEFQGACPDTAVLMRRRVEPQSEQGEDGERGTR
jgi:amino-acid N-acetyltransferase